MAEDEREMVEASEVKAHASGPSSVDAILDTLGFGAYQRLLFVLCGVGWAADIMDVQAVAFLIPALKQQWGYSNESLGLVPSFTFFGMLLGSLFWGMTSDRIGRRPVFMLTALIAGISGVLTATSPSVGALVALRFVQGFGLGGNLAVDFGMFIEFMPTVSRGRMTALLTIFATLGNLFAAALAWLLMESAGWRVYMVLCSLPGLVVAIFRSRMLESPHFLASNGRLEECYEVLRRVATFNDKELPITSSAEILYEKSGQPAFFKTLNALTCGNLRLRIVAACSYWFSLTFAFYGFSIWMPSYFQERGFEAQKSYGAVVTSVACQIPGVFTAAFLIDKLGRSRLLISFALLCSGSLIGFVMSETHEAMLGFSLVVNFMVIGLWSVTYTYTSEMFPTVLRTTSLGLCSATSRVSGILVSVLGGWMLSISVSASVMSYSVAYLCCALSVYLLGIDTTKIPLSQIVEDPSNLLRDESGDGR